MTPIAIFMMILICGVVFGGFATLMYGVLKGKDHR